MRTLMRAFAPLIAWVGAMAVLAYLVTTQFQVVDAIGVLESQVVAIVPLVDGKIQSIGVAEFDQVEVNQVVATLDDAVLQAEKRAAQAQITQLRATLEAAIQDIERERMTDLRRFETDEESARLDLLDRIVSLESDKAELARVSLLLTAQSRLVEQGIVARQTYEDLTIREEGLKTRIEENEKAILFVREKLAETTKRKQAYLESAAPAMGDSASRLLAPIRESIHVQQAEVDRLTELMEQHILRAPIAGVVTLASALGRSSMPTGAPIIAGIPGESVMAGVPFLEITNPQTARVNAWIEESRVNDAIREGAQVQVISRRTPREIAQGAVVNVGSRIEQFPLRADPMAMPPKWGLRVVIDHIPIQNFLPGEIVDIHFLPTTATTEDGGALTWLLSRTGLRPQAAPQP